MPRYDPAEIARPMRSDHDGGVRHGNRREHFLDGAHGGEQAGAAVGGERREQRGGARARPGVELLELARALGREREQMGAAVSVGPGARDQGRAVEARHGAAHLRRVDLERLGQDGRGSGAVAAVSESRAVVRVIRASCAWMSPPSIWL